MSTSHTSSGYASTPAQRRPRGGATPPSGPVHDLVALTPEERGTIEVLIVDDEHSLRESCASLLKSEGYPVTVVGRGHEALKLVKRRRFDILLLDLYMSQVSGQETLRAALQAFPTSLCIVMTGNPSVESSVAVLRDGAWDYLPKPFSASHFQVLLGRAAHAVMVARESEASRHSPTDAIVMGGGQEVKLLGESEAFRGMLDVARKVATTDASVFLTGESGSGKEVIAHYIHTLSRRSSRPLVPLNCAAIPEHLLESEMFGHLEGAFTGAVKDKPGLLEAANGGVLFLDELTEMPVSLQAKLLRVLQDGVVRRVGSTKTDAVVNVRFIASTNRDPLQAIREGRLRKDLFYRLRVVPLHVLPLRERREDIPVLARQFLGEFWQHHRVDDAGACPAFSNEAMRTLVNAPWPGNIRELRNVIEHLVVLASPGADISASDIPFLDDLEQSDGRGALFPRSVLEMDYHSARDRVLAQFESIYLKHVVSASGGNISDAARLAGVDRTTLYRLMEKHGTRRDDLVQEDGRWGFN